jgi:hypothetical protein
MQQRSLLALIPASKVYLGTHIVCTIDMSFRHTFSPKFVDHPWSQAADKHLACVWPMTRYCCSFNIPTESFNKSPGPSSNSRLPHLFTGVGYYTQGHTAAKRVSSS